MTDGLLTMTGLCRYYRVSQMTKADEIRALIAADGREAESITVTGDVFDILLAEDDGEPLTPININGVGVWWSKDMDHELDDVKVVFK